MNGSHIIKRLSLIAAFSVISHAQGAITVTQSTNGAGSDTFSAAFDVINASSVLVVGFYVDDADGSRNPANPRFGNGGGIGSGDVAPDSSYNSDRMNFYVFLNPDTAGGLQFSIDNSSSVGGYTYAMWELAGVELDTGTFTVSTNTSITTDSANEFIVSIAGANGSAANVQHNAGSDILLGSVIGGNNAPGGGGMRGGTIQTTSPGTFDVSWTTSQFEGQIAIAFQAVPEPSCALLSLLGIGLACRRKRA